MHSRACVPELSSNQTYDLQSKHAVRSHATVPRLAQHGLVPQRGRASRRTAVVSFSRCNILLWKAALSRTPGL
eukprot:351612-Chlamydomonas_euryale.AAC.6